MSFDVSYDNCNADANVLMTQIISNFKADGVGPDRSASPLRSPWLDAGRDRGHQTSRSSSPPSRTRCPVDLVASLDAPGSQHHRHVRRVSTPAAVLNLIFAAEPRRRQQSVCSTTSARTPPRPPIADAKKAYLDAIAASKLIRSTPARPLTRSSWPAQAAGGRRRRRHLHPDRQHRHDRRAVHLRNVRRGRHPAVHRRRLLRPERRVPRLRRRLREPRPSRPPTWSLTFWSNGKNPADNARHARSITAPPPINTEVCAAARLSTYDQP